MTGSVSFDQEAALVDLEGRMRVDQVRVDGLGHVRGQIGQEELCRRRCVGSHAGHNFCLRTAGFLFLRKTEPTQDGYSCIWI